MITEEHVMQLFERANPAPLRSAHTARPSTSGHLDALRTRSSTDMQLGFDDQPEQRTNRRLMMAAAAVAAIALIGGLLAFAGGDDDAGEPAAATVLTTTPPPTTAPALSEADAVAVAERYFADFNAGDVDAVLAAYTSDIVVTEPWESYSADEWALQVTYYIAGEWEHQIDECTPFIDADGVSVRCSGRSWNPLERAIAGEGVDTIVTLEVTEDGISAITVGIGGRDFTSAADAWDSWREAQGIEFDGWGSYTTPEEAVLAGENELMFTRQWQQFVIDAVTATIDDLNSGDIDAFLVRFPNNVFGEEHDAARTTWEQAQAAGVTLQVTGCSIDGVSPAGGEFGGLIVACVATATAPGGESATGALQTRVDPNGLLRSSILDVDIAGLLEPD